ncbi:MAG TPA: sulfatase [Vicinamibacterales bacterium]|nr:sulfatase [Vicinamibacterales bacterium]
MSTRRAPLAAELLAVAVVAVLFGGPGRDVDAGQAARPNIVIIFADDLGYGDLASYGHPTIRTPRLDRMAAEGVRLTSFYVASPSCSPSRAALLTGRYPIRTGVNVALGPESQIGLPDEEVTLAEALGRAGYRTAIVGKWHLGSQPAMNPLNHGFDRYFGLLYSNDMIRPWVGTDRPLELYRDRAPVEHPVDQSTLTERYTEEAVAFIRENRDQPFFLYLPHSMPHVPLAVSERFRGRSAAGLYGDVIESLDWSTGVVLDTIAELGLDDRTLVIFTSDNGPWAAMPDRMFAGDMIKPWDAGSSGPLRGSKASSWEGGVRVPFLARWPGRIRAGTETGALVTALDVLPTVLAATGVPLPPGRRLDGYDVTAALTGDGPSPRTEFFYLNDGRLEAVRDGRWKLRVVRAGEEGVTAELFDLDVDPYERSDRASREPETLDRLAARMRQFAAETGAATAADRLRR